MFEVGEHPFVAGEARLTREGEREGRQLEVDFAFSLWVEDGGEIFRGGVEVGHGAESVVGLVHGAVGFGHVQAWVEGCDGARGGGVGGEPES